MELRDLEQERDLTLAALVSVAEQTAQIEGLWLQGSLARGDADPLSDIDAYLAIDDAAFDDIFARREALVGRIRPILAWSDGTSPGLKCVHALLDGGVRLDLFFEAGSQVSAQSRPVVKVLVDKSNLAARLRLGWKPSVEVIGQIVGVIVRMTRQGGTWPLRTLLRGQWSAFAMMELQLINAQVAQLMAVQTDPALFYHNPFSLPGRLREEQRAFLDQLTAEVLAGVSLRDHGALLTVHLKVLDTLVREGRAACASLGVEYPILEKGDAKLRRFLQDAWPR